MHDLGQRILIHRKMRCIDILRGQDSTQVGPARQMSHDSEMLRPCMFFFSSRRRHTRCSRDWSSDVCSSDLDGERRIGTRLMAEQFPNAVRDALEILPRDHELREMLESRKDLPPEKMPMWDAVLVFPPGVKWEERSPAPIWWTKQTSFIGEEKPGKMTAVFWKKSTRQPPVNSDWYLEAR